VDFRYDAAESRHGEGVRNERRIDQDRRIKGPAGPRGNGRTVMEAGGRCQERQGGGTCYEAGEWAGPRTSAGGQDTFHMKRSGGKGHLRSPNAAARLRAAVGAPVLACEKAKPGTSCWKREAWGGVEGSMLKRERRAERRGGAVGWWRVGRRKRAVRHRWRTEVRGRGGGQDSHHGIERSERRRWKGDSVSGQPGLRPSFSRDWHFPARSHSRRSCR
jgi:hypothetical protein